MLAKDCARCWLFWHGLHPSEEQKDRGVYYHDGALRHNIPIFMSLAKVFFIAVSLRIYLFVEVVVSIYGAIEDDITITVRAFHIANGGRQLYAEMNFTASAQ